MNLSSQSYAEIIDDDDQTLKPCRGTGQHASQDLEDHAASCSPKPAINPKPAPLFEKSEQIPNRFAFCKNYDRCLDFAIASNWSSFTCEQCNRYELLQYSPQQWLEENLKCMDLIDALEEAERPFE